MKRKINLKKTLILTTIILVVAVFFLWWLGNKVNEISTVNKQNQSENQSSDNELIPQNIIDEFLSFTNKKNNPSLDETDENNKESLASRKPIIINYSKDDLQISTNTTSSSFKVYALQISQALKPFEQPRDNEAHLLLEALETEDQYKAIEIYHSAKVHHQALENILKITVPKKAVDIHLDLLKRLNKSTVLLYNMSQVEDSPESALESGLEYQKAELELFKSIANLNSFFREQGLKFNDDEKIKIFVNVDET